MDDIVRAFQLLDMIQGHPGYATLCVACNQPLTDWFGTFEPSPIGIGVAVERDGARHDLPAVGACPFAYFGSGSDG